MSERMWFFKGA